MLCRCGAGWARRTGRSLQQWLAACQNMWSLHCLSGLCMWAYRATVRTMQKHHMSVGAAGSDITGFTNQHIQAAVDRLAWMGGGTVLLSAGTFDCADAVHMRSNVCLEGQGRDTVLRKNKMKESLLAGYIAYGHEDLIVAEPDNFSIGDGFILSDNKSGGFKDTQGTIIGRDLDVLIASTRHETDYWHTRDGIVKTLYPLVSVKEEHNVLVQNLLLDGNTAENDKLNGCRGGAFFAHFADDISVHNVHVDNFNGEGFSFQTCERMHISDSSATGCTGNGFHPGSGSLDFHIHHCRGCHNQDSGLFYCVRVRNGLLEDCEFNYNKRFGVSIGERDVGSMNRQLRCNNNGGAGIYFRNGDVMTAAHDTVIESCELLDNGDAESIGQIHVQGAVHGVRISESTLRGDCGVFISPDVESITCDDLQYDCRLPLRDERS